MIDRSTDRHFSILPRAITTRPDNTLDTSQNAQDKSCCLDIRQECHSNPSLEMKIGVANMLSDYEVDLPPEIIAVILEYVSSSNDTRLRTLWSCCLLSKAWYKSTIAHLYEKPKLTNKNFDKFARTICPPVNAHVRRVGLETLVRQLDMGRLAYESTNSLTARLLRRTRMSLEVFVAPATSFSISSLAPLSKCSNLRTLDLSRDFYDILLGQLLNSIKLLPIQTLSLPRSAMRRPFQLQPRFATGQTWPMMLVHLGINDWLPSNVDRWHELFESFPPSLTSLAFEDCFNWNSFWTFSELKTPAINIKSIRISIRREDGGFSVGLLQKAFPNATSITIPAPFLDEDQVMTIDNTYGDASAVQCLNFTPLPDAVRRFPRLTTKFLSDCVKSFPALRRITVPDTYHQEDEDDEDIDKVEEMMRSRSVGGEESGIYLI